MNRIIDRELASSQQRNSSGFRCHHRTNALSQAKVFREATNVTGIVLTKLDGTAKGGIIFAIKAEQVIYQLSSLVR